MNHFPGEHLIGAKDRLARLVDGLPLCPHTFVLPEDAAFLREASSKPGSEALWIVKPCQLGEGRHVHVLRGHGALEAAGAFTQPCVVSEYIANPLLIDGRKVDLRMYVLVKAMDPRLEAFIFHEGLARICDDDVLFQQDHWLGH